MWSRGRESSYMPDMARKRAFRIGRFRTGLGLFATAPIKKGAFIAGRGSVDEFSLSSILTEAMERGVVAQNVMRGLRHRRGG
jgi:hypothetical protein